MSSAQSKKHHFSNSLFCWHHCRAYSQRVFSSAFSSSGRRAWLRYLSGAIHMRPLYSISGIESGKKSFPKSSVSRMRESLLVILTARDILLHCLKCSYRWRSQEFPSRHIPCIICIIPMSYPCARFLWPRRGNWFYGRWCDDSMEHGRHSRSPSMCHHSTSVSPWRML